MFLNNLKSIFSLVWEIEFLAVPFDKSIFFFLLNKIYEGVLSDIEFLDAPFDKNGAWCMVHAPEKVFLIILLTEILNIFYNFIFLSWFFSIN